MSDKDLFPSSAIREREYLSVKYRKKIKEDYPYERWLHWGSWLAFETNDPQLVIDLLGSPSVELVDWSVSGLSPKPNWDYSIVTPPCGKFVFVPNAWCGRPRKMTPWLEPYLPLADVSSMLGNIYLFDLHKNAGFAFWSNGELQRAIFSNENNDPFEEIGESLSFEPEPRKLKGLSNSVYWERDIWDIASLLEANLWHLAPLEDGEEVKLWAINKPYWMQYKK